MKLFSLSLTLFFFYFSIFRFSPFISFQSPSHTRWVCTCDVSWQPLNLQRQGRRERVRIPIKILFFCLCHVKKIKTYATYNRNPGSLSGLPDSGNLYQLFFPPSPYIYISRFKITFFAHCFQSVFLSLFFFFSVESCRSIALIWYLSDRYKCSLRN